MYEHESRAYQAGGGSQDADVAGFARRLLSPIDLAATYTSDEIARQADAAIMVGRSTLSFAEVGLDQDTLDDTEAVFMEEFTSSNDPETWQKLPEAMLAVTTNKTELLNLLISIIEQSRYLHEPVGNNEKLAYLERLRLVVVEEP